MRQHPSIARTILVAAFVSVVACDRDPAGPEPTEPALPTRAIALVVDVENGTVRGASGQRAEALPEGLNLALLGENEIQATVTQVARTAISSTRARVTFDLALTNQMANADLVAPTFPAPPAAQVVAFPFRTEPAGLLGWRVVASPDWDGAAWNFFNDGLCVVSGPPSDCYRWEGFGSTIPAGGTTPARRVGFDVDLSVTSFTVYIVVAADIAERPIPPAIGISEIDPVFTALVGGDPPAGRQLQVTNTGGGTITGLQASVSYKAGQPKGWLSATLGSTTAPATVTLQASTATLDPGVYGATVTLQSPDVGSPVSISVGLIVAQPLLVLAPKSAKFTAGAGGTNPPAQVVQVTSASGIPVTGLTATVTYGAAPSGWLAATFSGTTTPATLSLTASVAGLSPGSYTARVDVASPLGAAEAFTVRFDVLALPDLAFTGTPVVTAAPGSATVSGLKVTNQGTASSAWWGTRILLCLSPTPSSADRVACNLHRIGRSLSVSEVFDLPPIGITVGAGTYYVFVELNPQGSSESFDESDLSNNVLALGAVVVPAPLPSVPDAFEPNETGLTAWALPTLYDDGPSSSITATLHTSVDRDHYRVRAEERSTSTCVPGTRQDFHFSVQLTEIPSGEDYDLAVGFTPGERRFLSSRSGNSDEDVGFLRTGTCGSNDVFEIYIEVSRFTGLPSGRPYRLTTSFTRQ